MLFLLDLFECAWICNVHGGSAGVSRVRGVVPLRQVRGVVPLRLVRGVVPLRLVRGVVPLCRASICYMVAEL